MQPNNKLQFLKLSLPFFITLIIFSCNQSKKEPQLSSPIQPDTSKKTSGLKYTGGNEQLPIWTTTIPDSQLITGTETYNDEMVRNVSHPTMTIFKPTVKNTGVAAVVFPGGGYNALAIELSGSEVCEWLASIGVTGILLKYRVPGSGPHYDKNCDCHKDAVKPLALQDAQRTIGLIRMHAKEWNIDPTKIGVVGFSAGGHMVADVSTRYRQRVYPIMDEADKISCRPDFGMAIYPGHMTQKTTRPYQLNQTIPVDGNTPPMFIVQAGNDPVDSIQNSLVYYIALKKAGVAAEYHVYAEGGHAFGLRKTKFPITEWPKLAERWLHTIGMMREN